MRKCRVDVEFCRLAGVLALEGNLLVAASYIQGFLESQLVFFAVYGNDAFAADVDYAQLAVI